MWYLNLWILNWGCRCCRTDWIIALLFIKLWFISHDERLGARWSHLLFMRCRLRILDITTFPDLWLREELFAFCRWCCFCWCWLFKKLLRRCCTWGPRLWCSGLSRRWFITRTFSYKLNFARWAITLPIVLRLNTAIWAFLRWRYISQTELVAAR